MMSCCKQRQRLQPARELHTSPLVGSVEKTGGFVPRLNFILFFHCLDCFFLPFPLLLCGAKMQKSELQSEGAGHLGERLQIFHCVEVGQRDPERG